jgi:hypothetical protein
MRNESLNARVWKTSSYNEGRSMLNDVATAVDPGIPYHGNGSMLD